MLHSTLHAHGVCALGALVSLFVCVSTFSASSAFLGPLKLTFSSGKVALVKKPVFLHSTYRSEHSEAQESFFSNLGL